MSVAIKNTLRRIEAAIQQALTTFFVLLAKADEPEFWHESQDLKPLPIPVRPSRQRDRRQ